MAQWHKHWPVRRGLRGLAPGNPQNGGSRGGRKKWPKLSRLGELLNTQKNVHFFAPRGTPPGGGVRGGFWGVVSDPPKNPLLNTKYSLFGPKTAQNGGPGGAAREPPGGAPGAPRGRPPGGAPGGAPRARAPGRGRPGGRPGRGVRDPHFGGSPEGWFWMAPEGCINIGPSGEDWWSEHRSAPQADATTSQSIGVHRKLGSGCVATRRVASRCCQSVGGRTTVCHSAEDTAA